MKIFAIFITVLYLSIGIALLLVSPTALGIGAQRKTILAILFLVYASFRGYRVYKKYFVHDRRDIENKV